VIVSDTKLKWRKHDEREDDMEIEFIYRETYHFHDVGRADDMGCRSECFELSRLEVDAILEDERDEFKEWILGNPSVGDKFYGGGNDVALVQRVPDVRVELPWWVRKECFNAMRHLKHDQINEVAEVG